MGSHALRLMAGPLDGKTLYSLGVQMPASILVVTGASGAGKTTLVRATEARALANVRCHYFDMIGVPSPEQMTADFGSPEAWQVAKTHEWIKRLADAGDDSGLDILDGQMKPAVVQEAYSRNQIRTGHMLLLDCSAEVRAERLRIRGQPELAGIQMTTWAAYLRGQADALLVPVLDTTAMNQVNAGAAFEQHVLRLIVPAV